MKQKLRLSMYLSLLLVVVPAYGNEVAAIETECLKDICFDRALRQGEEVLPLRGMAHYTFWGFSVYTAAFYAPEKKGTLDILAGDVPRALVLHYHRTLQADDFIESSEKTLEKNKKIPKATIREPLQKLYLLYERVGEGDRYTLSYQPDQGTSLALNGALKGIVPGETFARAYFGLWLTAEGLHRRNWRKLLGMK